MVPSYHHEMETSSVSFTMAGISDFDLKNSSVLQDALRISIAHVLNIPSSQVGTLHYRRPSDANPGGLDGATEDFSDSSDSNEECNFMSRLLVNRSTIFLVMYLPLGRLIA